MKKIKLSNKIEKNNKKYKSIYELFKNYNGNYVCSEFSPKDVKGKEIW